MREVSSQRKVHSYAIETEANSKQAEYYGAQTTISFCKFVNASDTWIQAKEECGCGVSCSNDDAGKSIDLLPSLEFLVFIFEHVYNSRLT